MVSPITTAALLSDLHLDFSPYEGEKVEADIILLAGDVCEANKKESPIRWAQRRFPDQPVLFVPGNHDFYGGRFGEVIDRWRKECRKSNVRLLYNEVFEFQGLRFLGAPLWSDIASGGIIQEAFLRINLPQEISDFSCIINSQGKNWKVNDMLRENAKSLLFLREALKDTTLPNVVMTHWAPHRGSLHPMFDGHRVNPYFINHYPDLVAQSMAWFHGHTHLPCDYEAGYEPGHGRVICHPRGYPHEEQRSGQTYRPLRLGLNADTGEVTRLED